MKMLLIDGNSVLFRGFYATYYTALMQTKDGTYTNAVYAFSNMINKAINLIHPEYCVVAFDKAKHNFRHELSKDYKANRKPAPVELGPQFALVREFLSAYNIPFLEYDDVEGDDIIGSLAKKYPDVDICILTSDKDILQLLDDTTSVYFMRKGLSDIDIINRSNLKDIWPVRPDQIADLKGLMGDSSDNIPGVKGVGEKSAASLLNKYDSIEGIYENIDEIKGKLKEKLLIDKDSAFLSKILATIKTDVIIDNQLDEFKLNLDNNKVNEFYLKYEMNSLIKKVNNEIKTQYQRVNNISQELLKDGLVLYLDTDEFSYYEAQIYGLAISYANKVEYIPYEDFISDNNLITFLNNPDNHIKTYNLKALLHAFDNKNIKINCQIDDLMLMGFLYHNDIDSLESLFNRYNFNISYTISDIYGSLKKPKVIDTIIQTTRASEIALGLYEIYDDLLSKLQNDNLYDLYFNTELKLSYVLYDMEKTGIYCDKKILDEIGIIINERLDNEIKAIYEYAGHEFNINSPYQLADVLFDELLLPTNKKRSTNVEELERLELYHPIVKEIMNYRKDAKLYSSYIEGLKKYIKEDNKIHTIFSQTITQTGRLSSFDPNLQNIAVRDEDGRMIRKAFIASNSNNYLLSSDYSQIELRVLSALSNEDKMIDAFNKNIDIHTKTAMEIFNLNEDEVTSMHRRKAKAVNFGVVYGISDFGLAKQAGVSLNEARLFIANYFKTYPHVKDFLDESISFCKENGYVKTILNRRRYIKEINSSNYIQKEFGKRAAMNSKVQGSAADLIKVAMINIYQKIKEKKLKSRMVLQIHDELIFDVDKDEVDIMQKLVYEEMINALDLNVKLDVSMSLAKSWYEAK